MASRPDVIAAEGESGIGLCLLGGDRKLECFERTTLVRSFEEVEDFEISGTKLVIATAGKIEVFDLVFDSHRMIETQDRIIDVSWTSQCWRRADKTLVCERNLNRDDIELAGVEQFCEGESHGCALRDGRVLCWGKNMQGALGFEPRHTARKPDKPVAGLPLAAAIDCEGHYSCALTQAGEVWCWGDDEFGQLGRGAPLGSSTTAAPVRGIEHAVGMRLFSMYGCAALADESLRCWGDVPEKIAERLNPHDSCLTADFDDWKRRLEAAKPGPELADALAELGLRTKLISPRVRKVSVRSVELDGAAPTEWVAEVWLAGEGDEVEVAAKVYLAGTDGRWCAAADLSQSQSFKQRAADELPGKPDFMAPQELEFIELLAPGRSVIARHSSFGSIGYIESTAHQLSYLELRKGELVEIFDFVLYESTWESKGSSTPGVQPKTRGRVELTGSAPRTIVSETSIDCTDVSVACTPGTKRKTWTYDGAQYR